MRKAIIIALTLIILCAGCSNNTSKITQQPDPAVKLESQKSNSTPVAKIETTPSVNIPSTEAAKAPSTTAPKINPPQQYVNFLREQDKNDKDDIAYYAKEDIDLDGNDEIIIASGVLDEEEPTSSYIAHIYLLRDNNGRLEQMGEDLNKGGYGVYEIKLISLQNMPKKYIYCGITNGANLVGFEIYGLSDNHPDIICYSASATGSGEDVLRDFDNDGQYDGYVQNRASYDVLYYPLCRTYIWKDSTFELESTHVDIPEYPEDIKEVLIQYLALWTLDDGYSSEIKERLAELCIYDKADAIKFPEEILYSSVYDTLMDFDGKMEFDVKESSDGAKVLVTFTDEAGKKYTYTFHLIKSNNKWRIDNIG